MAARKNSKNPMNDNVPVGNDNKRPWKERKAEWLKAYHKEYMRQWRERERKEAAE